jgi:hypothetical protein
MKNIWNGESTLEERFVAAHAMHPFTRLLPYVVVVLALRLACTDGGACARRSFQRARSGTRLSDATVTNATHATVTNAVRCRDRESVKWFE